VPYTILRYGSLYGPRADERNAIFRFIKQAIDEGKITRHGDGEELREYIHVLDAAKGSVEILAKDYQNQYMILTGHQQMRLRDLLVMIKEMFDNKIEIEYTPAVENYHYEITPYAFSPKTAKRLMRTTYLDMGQGILEFIYELHKKFKTPLTVEGVILKDTRTQEHRST
jgi:UDP-glucose 4-epimerase